MPQIRNVETVEHLALRARSNRAPHVWLELRGRVPGLEVWKFEMAMFTA